MKITFDVKNQILTRTDRNQVIANSSDFLEADINFSSEWAAMDKTMTFKNGNLVYTYVLTNDKVLQEQHLNLGVGTWKVSIIGVAGDQKVVTNECNLSVNASGWIGSVESPTQSVFEQLLVILQSLHTEAASTAVVRSAVAQYIADHYDELVKEAVIVGDVQEAIDGLVQDGTIDGMVAEQLPPYAEAAASAQVADWLEDNVDPDTGYVIDASLTTTLAAADAKAVGDRLGKIQSVATGTDLNTLTDRGLYRLSYSGTFVNSPIQNDANLYKYLEVLVQGTNILQRYTAYKGTDPRNSWQYCRVWQGSSWSAWLKGIDSAEYQSIVNSMPANQNPAAGTDLNTLTSMGYYRLSYSGSYVNSPLSSDTNKFKYVEVMVQGANILQRFVCYVTSDIAEEYYRNFDGVTWGSWVKGFSSRDINRCVINMSNNVNCTAGTDFNTLTERGYYKLSYSGTYVNSPVPGEANNFKFLEVLTEGSQVYQRYTLYKHYTPNNYEQYVRIYDGYVWHDWLKGFSLRDFSNLYDYAHREDSISETFSPNKSENQGQNVGTKIRVMTYNVANFNNDTATYITNGKLFNLRKTIAKIDADFALMQEDREYIDSGNTKKSKDYVYLPKYPIDAGSGGVTIRSKLNMTNMYILKVAGDRVLRTGLVQIGNDIKLLLISAHPIRNYNSTGVDSEATINMRAAEYQDIMQWANGNITLPSYSTDVPVSVPEHTHTIIGMDANCVTAEDKSNLETLSAANNMILANGGYLGWFLTEMRNVDSIDVISVSKNIIIDNVEAWSSKYNDLYSDHVPVVADLTLL